MTTLKIRRKGTITIPAKMRKKYKLEEGQTLTVIDLDGGMFLLVPKISQVDTLANQIAKRLKEENVTFSDLIQELNEVRKTRS